ncbi:MAG: hypothetical protein PHQ91_14750 [Thermoanaerobaculaceae bacterium]|nr:hypothetical protein [Thermoanaerobaculaceae bacterium]
MSSASLLRAAVTKLEAMLATKQIVWFAGRHLPQRVTLDERATTLRLAR